MTDITIDEDEAMGFFMFILFKQLFLSTKLVHTSEPNYKLEHDTRHRRYHTTLNICLIQQLLFITTQLTSKYMVMPWVALLEQLLLIYAWKLLRNKLCMHNAVIPPKVWKRFVDDSFAIIKKSAVLSLHDTLNSIDPHINFTIEHEKDGRNAFLDTLISRNNCSISIDVYRKPTHADR